MEKSISQKIKEIKMDLIMAKQCLGLSSLEELREMCSAVTELFNTLDSLENSNG